ncbi:MAG: PP2C family protein-serine/threonine phosphatase [Gammaproteobacteria bacterium]
MPWNFGAAQDIGGRKEQQDRLTVLSSPDGRRHLAVIADGMGGLRNGAQAAQIVVDVAAKYFSDNRSSDPRIFLNRICQAAHEQINNLPVALGPAPGTTILLLYLDNRHAYWAHVGDTRLYHCRNGAPMAQTSDHSLLQLMIAKGLIGLNSDAAKAMQSQLYMRLGGDQIPEPDFAAAAVKDGDVFILCSDGFWQAVQPAEVMTVLEAHPLPSDSPDSLVQLARQRSGDGCDNISLALFQWSDDSLLACCKRFSRRLFMRNSRI